MFFISFSIPIIQTTTMTMLQEKVQIEMQERIFSLLNAIFSGLMPLGMILFGVLADIVSINYSCWCNSLFNWNRNSTI